MEHRWVRSVVVICVAVSFAMNRAAILWAQEPVQNPREPQGIITVPGSPMRISLDLRGMDIIDVLKLFAQRSGMNIVAGLYVQGRLTLFLKDVDLWDAFEIILVSNGLAYDRKGDIINVMTDRDYELIYGDKYLDKKRVRIVPLRYAKAVDVNRALSQVKSNVGKVVIDEGTDTLVLVDIPEKLVEMERLIREIDIPLLTEVFTLNYAKAEDVKAKLQESLTKGIGKIELDQRTNKLIVTELARRMPEIERLIFALDAKSKEVLIDAKIIQIELNDKHQMGVSWETLLSRYNTLNLKSAFSQSLSTFGKITLGTLTEEGYTALVEALQTVGKTELLSSPRITVISGQEAKILVGRTQPYVTTTTTTSTSASVTSESVQFVDVGVKLFVTPTINDEGFVSMKIRPEISSLLTPLTTASKNEIPVVDKSEAETTVMVKDGVTIVIGGLIDTKSDLSVKKIPGLGDLPLLGWAFRSTTREIVKKEKVIFLTPHIITGDRDHKTASLKSDPVVVPMGKELITAQEITIGEETIRPVSPLPWGATAADYHRYIRNLIRQQLSEQYPGMPVIGEVGLSFVVLATGRLKESPQVLTKDANPQLVRIATKSIQQAAPFPVFPASMKTSEETFTIVVSYEK